MAGSMSIPKLGPPRVAHNSAPHGKRRSDARKSQRANERLRRANEASRQRGMLNKYVLQRLKARTRGE